ncbi:MAG TPA: rod-binding protein [Candidatus Limnocylindria bacterium]|jgi:flagellar protein FlgJ|nr:rod-binding protein [Candidatus Limnocylindria bacterium]
MEIQAQSPALSNPGASIPLERLADDRTIPEGDRLKEACRQFEAVLVRQILGEGQKPMVASKDNLNAGGSSIYRDMVNAQMADQMTRGDGIGLSRALSHELSRRQSPANANSGAPKS